MDIIVKKFNYKIEQILSKINFNYHHSNIKKEYFNENQKQCFVDNNFIVDKVLNNFVIPKKIAIALSGGSDSMALLFLLLQYFKNQNIEFHALTVDHRVRVESTDESIELKKLLDHYFEKNNFEKNNFQNNFLFKHQILSIPKDQIPNRNIEAKLRELRYQLLSKYCHDHQIELLFLGHHLSDIAENFLIRLFRGSTIEGLSSIKEITEINNLKLIRPLLDFTKKELQIFLHENQINWFEDQTNQDQKFLRNKIRKFLLDLPDQDLIQNRIKKTADYFLSMRNFFEEKVMNEMNRISKKTSDQSYLVNYLELKTLPEEIALKILANILLDLTKKPYKPRKEKLLNLLNHLINQSQIKTYSLYHCSIKKVNDQQVLFTFDKSS